MVVFVHTHKIGERMRARWSRGVYVASPGSQNNSVGTRCHARVRAGEFAGSGTGGGGGVATGHMPTHSHFPANAKVEGGGAGSGGGGGGPRPAEGEGGTRTPTYMA